MSALRSPHSVLGECGSFFGACLNLSNTYRYNKCMDTTGMGMLVRKNILRALLCSLAFMFCAGLPAHLGMTEENYREDEKALRERLSLNAKDDTAMIGLGEVLWKRGDKKGAEKLFAKAVKTDPDNPVGHFYLGKAYVFRNDVKKAMKEFDVFEQKMDKLPSDDEKIVDFYVESLQYITHIYSTVKDYARAIKISEKAVRLKPEDPDLHYNLAVGYYYIGKLSKAYEELRKVIEIEPVSVAADSARYCMDFIRSNPDPRVKRDFSFLYED